MDTVTLAVGVILRDGETVCRFVTLFVLSSVTVPYVSVSVSSLVPLGVPPLCVSVTDTFEVFV